MTKNENVEDLVAFDKWLRELGRDAVTGWRWRTKYALPTVNIAGRIYISRAAIREFTDRAKRGEFFQAPTGAAGRSSEARKEKQQ